MWLEQLRKKCVVASELSEWRGGVALGCYRQGKGGKWGGGKVTKRPFLSHSELDDSVSIFLRDSD